MAEHWILAIDSGNSRVKFGLFRHQTNQLFHEPVEFIANDLQSPLPVELLRQWWRRAETGGSAGLHSIAGGSNPKALDCLLAEWPGAAGNSMSTPDFWPRPHVVRSGLELPLAIDVEAPERVGLDRLFNAVAGNTIRRPDQPALLIDAGTATTIDWLDAQGRFCGGAILPGIELGARALHQYTALLPLVSRQELSAPHPSSIGRNTRAAMSSGLYWGHVGAIRELSSRMSTETEPPVMLLTGGSAGILADEFPEARHIPALGLWGMILSLPQLRQST
ncbi:MAG: hypothetical protein C0478_14430 [Planctomyces sp.]|nr:hypothetical protein [Planctomyces sp.]